MLPHTVEGLRVMAATMKNQQGQGTVTIRLQKYLKLIPTPKNNLTVKLITSKAINTPLTLIHFILVPKAANLL